MKTFEEVHVGFQKTYNYETNGYDSLLGYIIRKPTDGWKKWMDKDIEPRVIKNYPRKGFKIVGSVKRSSDWFGSGRNMFRILHPEGFQFEITANNLLEILQSDNCINQEFQKEYALCWAGRDMALVPTDSDVYSKATELIKVKTFNKNTCEEGQKVILRIGSSQKEVYYLGYKTSLIKEQTQHRRNTFSSFRYEYTYNIKWDKHRYWFKFPNGGTISYTKPKYVRIEQDFINPETNNLFDQEYSFKLKLKPVKNKERYRGGYYGDYDYFFEKGILKSTWKEKSIINKLVAEVNGRIVEL